ncbi:hypothetical protein M231_05087 [Tremella mesenterica]|uniref:Peptidase A1 domain-containing protein n=1 Tax=Tremella mesenterica TaxID=5217 RepID=A0A4Q1BJ67_TREME|nr:hypothetical protein M231_05087 [Tremella mesenterica]
MVRLCFSQLTLFLTFLTLLILPAVSSVKVPFKRVKYHSPSTGDSHRRDLQPASSKDIRLPLLRRGHRYRNTPKRARRFHVNNGITSSSFIPGHPTPVPTPALGRRADGANNSLSSSASIASSAFNASSSQPSSVASSIASSFSSFPSSSSVAAPSVNASGSSSGPAPSATHGTEPLDSSSSEGMTYVITVKINGIEVPMVADTGSVVPWVAAKSCATCIAAGMVTAVDIPDGDCQEGVLGYGSGNVYAGCFVNVTFAIGDLVLPSLRVLAATEIDDVFQSQAPFMSGILGMGLSAGVPFAGVTQPLIAMYEAGLIDSPTVGFWLSPDSTKPSEMDLGSVDKNTHVDLTKQVSTAHVVNQSDSAFSPAWYSVQADALTIGDTTLSTNFITIIDTGTTDFYVPQSWQDHFYAAFGNGYIYWVHTDYGDEPVLPCQGSNNTMSLTFDGVSFDINYADIVGSELQPGWCAGLVGSDPKLHYVLAGDMFLKGVYSTYDLVNGTVTFNGLK